MSIIELAGDIGEMEEYEPLPDGVYPAQLQDVDQRSNEKTPQGFLTCQFRVSPDHYPADYDAANAPEGVIVTQGYIALPDPANRRTVRPFKKFLESIGQKMQGSTFDPDKWIGADCQLVLKRAEFQGAFVNNIEGIAPLPKV